MLDYIPFTKGGEDEIKVTGGTGGGKALKNQKHTLKFLQNKQNYAKINKVADYQTLLNSPEQITTRSLDIQQYEYYLRKIPIDSNDKNAKLTKGQQTYLPKKILQQPIKVENVHLSENIQHYKKLESALNRSKFNRGGSIGETYRSQDSLSSIQQITRYQQIQQQAQSYLDLQIQDDKMTQQQSILADQSLSSIKFEEQNKAEQSEQQNNEIVQVSQIEHQISDTDQQEDQKDQQFLEDQQSQKINESCIQSLYSVPQNYSINNEISLLNYEDDEPNEQEDEEEDKVEIQKKKQGKKQKQKQAKEKKSQLQNSLQQTASVVNQSVQSVKKSDVGRSNKISRQQSQMSLSDLDRVEQIIQQNANELDQLELVQREKMRQQIRELEEKIQKTKDKQEHFQYQPEDYADMSGEYLKNKKNNREQEFQNQQNQLNQQQQQLQQQQQQQQSQQQQQQQTNQQTKQPIKQEKKVQPAKISQPVIRQSKNKVQDNQSVSNLPIPNQQVQHPQTAQSQKPKEEASQIDKSIRSDGSIELESEVIKSLKELEQLPKNQHSVQLQSDPIIKIENKLKQIQEDIETTERLAAKQSFADFLLTAKNVFEVSYDEFKLFHVEKKIEEPPTHFIEEDKILFSQMKQWDAQNTGNSKKIGAVADIVRGIQTKFTSEANISEADLKTQKTIDSDWD